MVFDYVRLMSVELLKVYLSCFILGQTARTACRRRATVLAAHPAWLSWWAAPGTTA